MKKENESDHARQVEIDAADARDYHVGFKFDVEVKRIIEVRKAESGTANDHALAIDIEAELYERGDTKPMHEGVVKGTVYIPRDVLAKLLE